MIETLLLTEFSALRLSSWGLAVILLWLVWLRVIDHTFRDKLLHENIKGHSPIEVVVSAALLALMTILSFTAPMFEGYVFWFNSVGKLTALAAFPLMIGLQFLFIEKLAYNRRDKLIWCIGWIALSHVAKWGSLWLEIPQ